MKRREFLLATTAVGLSPITALTANSQNLSEDKSEYFELIKYHMHVGQKKKIINDFYRDAAIPALNRIGISPIGVFNVMHGPNKPTLYVLIPYRSLESFVTASSRLLEDQEYQKVGNSFINAPLSDPAYVRVESSLMVAFSQMPKLEVPTSLLNNKSRLYELRIYESHSKKANKKKIEMFNEGGEIEIFRKSGLSPVFFGETLVGSQMPNLTYMLVFNSMSSRDKNWETFRKHPDWLKLKDNPIYADTVSNITDIILRPTSFSQI